MIVVGIPSSPPLSGSTGGRSDSEPGWGSAYRFGSRVRVGFASQVRGPRNVFPNSQGSRDPWWECWSGSCHLTTVYTVLPNAQITGKTRCHQPRARTEVAFHPLWTTCVDPRDWESTDSV